MGRYSVLALLAFTYNAYAGSPDMSSVNGSLEMYAGGSYGDASSVNGGIHVGDNASIGNAHTVNGRITLGTAAVTHSLRTVNGAIVVGPGGQINGDASTTNGAISIGAGSHVSGGVSATNGAITLDSSAEISGYVSTVNGRIQLEAAHVSRGIQTISGGIDLGAHSRVEGGIWVRRSETWGARLCSPGLVGRIMRAILLDGCHPQLVVIGPEVTVQGPLRFDHPVRLYVNTSAHIGPVQGAAAIPFAGERPPA